MKNAAGEYNFNKLTLYCCSSLAFGKKLSKLMPRVNITCFDEDIRINGFGVACNGYNQEKAAIPFTYDSGELLSSEAAHEESKKVKLDKMDDSLSLSLERPAEPQADISNKKRPHSPAVSSPDPKKAKVEEESSPALVEPRDPRAESRLLTQKIAAAGQRVREGYSPKPKTASSNKTSIAASEIDSNNNASNNSNSSSDDPEASSSPDLSSVTKPSLRRS